MRGTAAVGLSLVIMIQGSWTDQVMMEDVGNKESWEDNRGASCLSVLAYVGCFQTYLISLLHASFHLFLKTGDQSSW